MCCGDSSRTSGGGTIAVLKGVDSSSDLSLLFHPNDSATTTATFQSSASNTPTPNNLEACQILIYRSGDLRVNADPQDVLYSFPLENTSKGLPQDYGTGDRGTDAFTLPQKLNLGVGGDGVIGRNVSLVRRTPKGMHVLRQGIIGWN